MIEKLEKLSQADCNRHVATVHYEPNHLTGDSLLMVRGCMIVPVKISSSFLDISLLLISSIGFLWRYIKQENAPGHLYSVSILSILILSSNINFNSKY